jgi:outer membrane protein assembly factor BamA
MRRLCVSFLVGVAALPAFASLAHAEDPDDPKSSIILAPDDAPKPPPPAPPQQTPPPPPLVPDGGASPTPDDAGPPAPPPPATPPPPKPASGPKIAPPPIVPSGESGLRDVPIPQGQTVDTVSVPGAIRDGRKGIGERIVEIKVMENSKTDANTVEFIAGVKLGDLLTPELVEQAQERLLSVGLFKSVNVYWEEMVAQGGYGVRLIIAARDNLSWIIAPIFAYSATEVGGGLAYAESNAFGQNKKFLALGQYTTLQRLLFLAWLDPQIRNTRWYYRVDALLRGDNIWEYAAGHYGSPRLSRITEVDTFGAGALVGINASRHFHVDFRLKLYYDNVHPSTCFNTTNRDRSGTPDVVAEQGGVCRQASSSGWDNTVNLSMAYDNRSKVYGVVRGLKVQVDLQVGGTWLGDRSNYYLISAAGQYGWRFFKEHTLTLKLGTDVYVNPPFKLEVETGGTNMRGYLYRQYRGDTDARATLEYMLPLVEVKGIAMRLVAFYDTNLTWFRSLPNQADGPLARFVQRDQSFRDFLPDTPSGLTSESWHNGLGGGLRFFLKGVVLPLVGVDVAYGFPPPGVPFDSASWQVYLALGSTLD